VRELLGEPLAALAVLLELEDSPEHLGDATNEGEALALEKLLRAVLARVLLKLWLVLKELQLRRRPGDLQIDHRLCLPTCLRIGGERIEGEGTKAQPKAAKEVAACQGLALRSRKLSLGFMLEQFCRK
jgi:hypothetical protein